MDLNERMADLEQSVMALNQRFDAIGTLPPQLPSLPVAPRAHTPAEWMHALIQPVEPGGMLNPGLARSTPCTRINLPDMGSVILSPGIAGPLDSEQVALYCSEGIIESSASPTQVDYLRGVVSAAQVCSAETDAITDPQVRVREYHACLARELKKEGRV